MSNFDWPLYIVSELEKVKLLKIENGNHGEHHPHRSEFTEQGTLFIRAADINQGRILFESASRINNTALYRIRKGIGSPGDTLLSCKGTVGKVALASLSCEPFVCSPQVTFWRSLDDNFLYYRFLYYYINSSAFSTQIKSVSGDTSMASYISLTNQRKFKIAIPNIDEQKALASILSSLDGKIELNQQMNQTLEVIARAIFKSWFVDFDPVRAKMAGNQPVGMDAATANLFPDSFEESALGLTPKGWRVKSLDEVIEVNPKRSLSKGQIAPYLDMKSMPTQGHRPDNWIEREFNSGTKFINGDTLMARITPCLENGKTAFVDFLEDGQIGWGSTEYIIFRPKHPLPCEFGYYLARSDDLKLFAIQNMTGSSSRQRTPPDCFKQYLIAVPSEKIVSKFGEIIKALMGKITSNSNQSRTLANIRDTLLPKLMSG